MKKNLFLNFLHDKRRNLIVIAVCTGIFALLFALYDVPLRYILYPALLCFVFVICFGAVRFAAYCRRHRQLTDAAGHIDVTTEHLPEAETLLEADYGMLLSVMGERKNEELLKRKQKNSETEEYVTLWSHQIKTPLTALTLLADEAEEQNRAALRTRIFEIEQYVDMMLQYLRLQEDTGTDLVPRACALRAMVNQSVKYFAYIFIEKKLTVNVSVPEDIKVITDEKWFVFILKQLISNALKYTQKGSVTVSAEKTENGYVKLSVQDTGIGIAKDDLPRIFERGYTGYNGRKDKKATGLGLYLTDRVVKMLGHGIAIDSEVGRGTTVTLTLRPNGANL